MPYRNTTERARALRKTQTEAERVLWKHLRDRGLGGFKFRRQRPVGPYIVDLFCHEKNLIVELDGERKIYDSERTAWLESQGYRVLRFWNTDVMSDVGSVAQVILRVLEDG